MSPTGRERELVRLVGQILTLAPEIRILSRRGLETPEGDAKEGTLERLQGQLAADAKRAATHELGNAP